MLRRKQLLVEVWQDEFIRDFIKRTGVSFSASIRYMINLYILQQGAKLVNVNLCRFTDEINFQARKRFSGRRKNEPKGRKKN